MRFWSRIAEIFLNRLGPLTGLDGLVVEIFDELSSVMLWDKISNNLWHSVVSSELLAILHVIDNKVGTLLRIQSIVRIAVLGLIFREKPRVGHFPYIVVISSHP